MFRLYPAPPQVLRVMMMERSKHSEKVATPGRQRTRDREVEAKPTAGSRGERSVRPLAPRIVDNESGKVGAPMRPQDWAAMPSAAGLQAYRRWAGFVAGPNSDFGFGAYFVDERCLADGAQSRSPVTAY